MKIKLMEKVIYCEWITLGNPIEREMFYKDAIKRYNCKLKALKGYLFELTSFVGIKNLKGEWIIINEKQK